MAEAVQALQLAGFLIPKRVPLLLKGKQLESNKKAYLEEQRPLLKVEGYLEEEHLQHNQALEGAYLEHQHRIKPKQLDVFSEVRIILQLQPKGEDFLEEANTGILAVSIPASGHIQSAERPSSPQELSKPIIATITSQADFLEGNSRLQHLLKEEDFLVKIRLQPLVVEVFLDKIQLQPRVVDSLDRIINNSLQEVVFLANLNNSKIKEALDVEFLSRTKILDAFPINSHKPSNSSRVL